jgi:hypothetical protein
VGGAEKQVVNKVKYLYGEKTSNNNITRVYYSRMKVVSELIISTGHLLHSGLTTNDHLYRNQENPECHCCIDLFLTHSLKMRHRHISDVIFCNTSGRIQVSG